MHELLRPQRCSDRAVIRDRGRAVICRGAGGCCSTERGNKGVLKDVRRLLDLAVRRVEMRVALVLLQRGLQDIAVAEAAYISGLILFSF
jgi:hypothetical protein